MAAPASPASTTRACRPCCKLFGAMVTYLRAVLRLEGIAYNMATLAESAEGLRAAGFDKVEISDRHDWYLELARRELQAMEGPLHPMIAQRIGFERARHFIDNWRQLVIVLERGELRPGHLKAVKPRALQKADPPAASAP